MENQAAVQKDQNLKKNMSKIKHKIAIISGKGGVGKSTVSANLAIAFAINGHRNRVGMLDVDIHGPCIPKLLGVKGEKLQITPNGAYPVTNSEGIKVVSMDFLVTNQETPIVWRGPLKMQAIKQFLSDFIWGELDFLFIDAPPGTGDEPLSTMQLIPEMDGTIIVTIPSQVSEDVVKKAVIFSRQMKIPVIGIVENMSGFVCPKCGESVNILGSGAGKRIAEELKVPFLGQIPMDPKICEEADKGTTFLKKYPDSPATKAFKEIVKKIEDFLKNKKTE
ncbi:MAG: Mrp/NBP35 family ATP-binding protein [Candidatus Bathyarchaeota archaeon]|nr:Mrp/NBP35 family ATP-binding protein [Candidatus Bathyarchaeum tardum]WGM88621.1 MAG: Mrp/NBP35 family ATP-binding protein [Candidatus Bathyarchaeum tardum]WNZ29123.1 MAG: Mrp/NBP35 family ATP-binding protein [Candidatus Bathyarchaeota archaeon]